MVGVWGVGIEIFVTILTVFIDSLRIAVERSSIGACLAMRSFHENMILYACDDSCIT